MIVVLVVFFLIFAQAGEKPSTRLVRTKDRKALPPIEEDDACVPYDDSPGALVIPLVSDENNIFNIELSVNGHWVQAAVDTGSEALLIGGEDCSKCRLGSPSQGQVPMPEGKHVTSMMRYGSQQDEVAWDVRPVRLRGWKYTCDEMDDDNALTDQDNPPHKPVCIVGDVQVAIVQIAAERPTTTSLVWAHGRREAHPPSSKPCSRPSRGHSRSSYSRRKMRN